MNIIGSCNSCLLEISSEMKYISCPDCNRLYHQDCWKKNNSKCIEYGCKGTKEIIEGSQPINIPNQNIEVDESQGEEIPTNNQYNFKKVNKAKAAPNKIIIFLILIIVALLAVILINNKSKPKIVVQLISPSPVVSASIEATQAPNVTESEVVTQATPESSEPTQIEQTSEPSVPPETSSADFNLDMNLENYYTIQVASETDLKRAEKIVEMIPNSFIRARAKSAKDKSKYFYVVVLGKFEQEQDARLYRKYIAENPSLIGNFNGFNGSFIAQSSSLEDMSLVSQKNQENSQVVVATESPQASPSVDNSNSYYTVQVASKESYEEAKAISENIPDSFIMKKYSKAQQKYYYVLVVGKLESREKAEEHKKYIIENYSNAGASDDVPKSWVVKSDGLIDAKDSQ